MHQPRRRRVALSLVAAGAALPVLLIAGAASAHVTVNPDEATQGGYTKLTFRVPNETDNAKTTKLRVFFPASQPLAFVSIQPHDGWSYRVKTTKLAKPISSDDGSITRAVSEVVWTADAPSAAIKPGEFDEFNVSAGPLPNASRMIFKALQTYSNGEVVRWIDPTRPGGPEAEHPAPVLTLVPPSDQTNNTTTVAARSSGGDNEHASSAGSDDGRANTALVLSILALVVAGAAAAIGRVRRSRS
jgi:periplasmic copper chaperone A